MDDHTWQDATEQSRAIRAGVTSAEALVTTTLARIERWNPTLRAYVSVDADRALAAARTADALLAADGPDAAPPFLGVPLSIKDVIAVEGLPTTHSAKALAGAVATADDPLVRRFRAAGFVIVGTTNVPELCSSMTDSELNGTCRNPWNLDHTPGGSSGGAGAATAAGLCALAHGTDGAGSVRAPASFCGLVGLKASRGLVAFGPQDSPDVYFGTSGPGLLTRSVRDAAAGLDVMVGTESGEPAWAPRPPRPYADQIGDALPRLRIAVCTTFPFGAIDDEPAAAAERTGSLLASLGHSVISASPDWWAILAGTGLPLEVPGGAALISPEDEQQLEPRNRPMVQRLRALTVLEHAQLVEAARSATREFGRFWDEHDVLVTPTFGILPPTTGWAPWDIAADDHLALFAGVANFTHPFNISGQPALSLPLAHSASGLPVGVQLAGRYLDEALLLTLAAEIEAAQPWAGLIPPGFA